LPAGVSRVHKVRQALKDRWAKRGKPGLLVRREPKVLPVRKAWPVLRVRLVRRDRQDLLAPKATLVCKVLLEHPDRKAPQVFKARQDPRE